MGDGLPRLPDVQRGYDVHFTFNGDSIRARAGETIAAALLAAGRRTLRHSARSGAPRGLFCGMGVCFDCVVMIDGSECVRACVTPAADGMIVTSVSA